MNNADNTKQPVLNANGVSSARLRNAKNTRPNFEPRDVVSISAGGFIGANARYLFGIWASAHLGSHWPFGTWIINITGCFVLGLFVPIQQARGWSDQTRLAVAIGFLGAYTTYSTFELDTYGLFQHHRYLASAVYVPTSFTAGFLAVYLGAVAARLLIYIGSSKNERN